MSDDDESCPPAAPTTTTTFASPPILDTSTIFHRLPMLALVRIFVARISPNYSSPWKKNTPKNVTGAGFIISGRRIVTNAHVVLNQIQVRCRQHGQTKKYSAKILAFSKAADLAVLTVNDEKFWKLIGNNQVNLRKDLPLMGEEVSCVGYPKGDHASITRGVVSRLLMRTFLSVQIDAAVNSGNSGGPVFDTNCECVGIACAHMKNTQNICYMIPIEVLTVFIENSQTLCNSSGIIGRSLLPHSHIGVPAIGVTTQTLENEGMRNALGLTDNEETETEGVHRVSRGVYVTEVSPRTPAWGVLREGDVVMSVDGVDVGSDATSVLRGAERIHWYYTLRRHALGKSVEIEYVRFDDGGGSSGSSGGGSDDSKTTPSTTKKRSTHKCKLILKSQNVKVPYTDSANLQTKAWAIFGGLVFLPCSYPLLESLKHTLPIGFPHDERIFLSKDSGTEQLVLLAQVLTDDVNYGFHSWRSKIVTRVNGVVPMNLAHFAHIVRSSMEGSMETFLDVEFWGGKRILLGNKSIAASEERISATYSIPKMISDQVQKEMDIFTQKDEHIIARARKLVASATAATEALHKTGMATSTTKEEAVAAARRLVAAATEAANVIPNVVTEKEDEVAVEKKGE